MNSFIRLYNRNKIKPGLAYSVGHKCDNGRKTIIVDYMLDRQLIRR